MIPFASKTPCFYGRRKLNCSRHDELHISFQDNIIINYKREGLFGQGIVIKCAPVVGNNMRDALGTISQSKAYGINLKEHMYRTHENYENNIRNMH
jgi:hypothetical protein